MKKLTIIGICIATMIACTPTKQSTIDTTLQTQIDSILQNKMSEINAISGQAIVMDIQTGEVKAMVGNGKKQSSSLMRAVSIHKALETGKVVLSDSVDTENGVVILNGDTIFDHNWHRGGYGKITLKKGLAFESEIAVSKALQIAGVEAVDSLVTPLEMLKLFNVIIKNDSLKSAFRYCVTDGLGKPASFDIVEVAGLSGRNVVSKTNPEKPEYAVEFIGYFPADKPKYSIIVSMNKIGFPASGGLMAGSVFSEIIDCMIEPDFSQVFNNEVKEDFISTFSKYMNVKEETIKERIWIMKCLNATEEEIVWYKNNIIRMDSVMHASINLVKNDDYINLAKLFEKERYDIYGHPHNDTYLCYELHLAMAMIYSITINNKREYYEKFADLLEYSKMMMEFVQVNWDEPHPLYKEVLEGLKQIYKILENQNKINEMQLLIQKVERD